MNEYRRSVWNKWAKHEVLRKGRGLSRYMPETKRMTRRSVRVMLRKYGMVYVKPVFGSLGIGVMKVTGAGRRLRYQRGTAKRSFPRFSKGYASILRAAKGKPYMVQQGIRMARYRGRPFDLRLVVQRRPGRNWRVTGGLVRLAHPRKIVTNGSQGGTIYPLQAMLPGRGTRRRLNRIALRSARRLHAVYPRLIEIGLDVAIDRRRRPWILEANTRPDPCPFTKLPNRRMLRRIVRYAGAWGRRYKLNCTKSRRAR
jgi:glutathione synthase/RimK-type ligase-like ATP-grasp enzyme